MLIIIIIVINSVLPCVGDLRILNFIRPHSWSYSFYNSCLCSSSKSRTVAGMTVQPADARRVDLVRRSENGLWFPERLISERDTYGFYKTVSI